MFVLGYLLVQIHYLHFELVNQLILNQKRFGVSVSMLVDAGMRRSQINVHLTQRCIQWSESIRNVHSRWLTVKILLLNQIEEQKNNKLICQQQHDKIHPISLFLININFLFKYLKQFFLLIISAVNNQYSKKKMKTTDASKPKVSKEFIEQLKNTPQIPPQKPKQVPIPVSNSQLPSPIISSNKNKREDDIKQYPIQKICLDSKKSKAPSKQASVQESSLKERKDNMNTQYQKAYPELLKPSRKEESSLVKKARDQRLSRSLIDMSIYHLLDETTDKKVKHQGKQKEEKLIYHNLSEPLKPQKQVYPKIDRSVEKVQDKKNGIKIVNNLKQNEHKQLKETKNTKTNKQNCQNYHKKGKNYHRDPAEKLYDHYLSQNRGYDYYSDPYHELRSKENYGPNSYRDIYGSYGNLLLDRKYDDRRGTLYGFGGYSSHLDQYSFGYNNLSYRNLLRYY